MIRSNVLRAGAASALLLTALAAGAAPAKAPGVTAVDAAGLKRVVAARKGRVVVMNFWATWCVPCVEEFPDLVRVVNKHRAKGLDLVTVSFDEPEDLKTKVVPFLQKQKIASGAYIQKGGPQQFVERFDPKWEGAVPRTYIYDRSGKVVKVLEGSQSAEAFEKAIAPVLAKR